MEPVALQQYLVAQQGVVRRDRLVALGVPYPRLRRQLHRGDWRAFGRHVLIASWASDTFETRARAAALSQPGLPSTGLAAILHYPNSALRPLLTAGEVPWLVSERSRSRNWLAVRHPGARVVARDGFRVLLEEDALVDLLRLLPLELALEAAWLGLRARVSTAERLSVKAKPLMTLAGRGQLAEVLRIIAGGAQSTGEARMIGILRRAGIAGQPDWLVVAGERRFRIDYAFPEVRLGVEFDGYRFHDGSPELARRTRQRHNILSNIGWDLRYFTWRDITETPERVVQQVLDAYALRTSETRQRS